MASYAVAPLRDTLSTKVETNFKVSTALELHVTNRSQDIEFKMRGLNI